MIVEKQRGRTWGQEVVQRIAKDRQSAFPGIKGFSASNLWRMKLFHETYANNQKLAPVVREIAWSHNLIIMERCKDDLQRKFHIIDLDPQSNLSITFGIDVINLKQSMGDVLMNEETHLNDILYRRKRLHIAPATMDLAIKQRQLQAVPDGVFHLKESLEEVRGQYNYIVIDTGLSS